MTFRILLGKHVELKSSLFGQSLKVNTKICICVNKILSCAALVEVWFMRMCIDIKFDHCFFIFYFVCVHFHVRGNFQVGRTWKLTPT
jgi:hypothetical protein